MLLRDWYLRGTDISLDYYSPRAAGTKGTGVFHGVHASGAAQGAGGLLVSQLLSKPAPLFLSRKPRAWCLLTLQEPWSPVLLMLLEMLLKLLKPTVISAATAAVTMPQMQHLAVT